MELVTKSVFLACTLVTVFGLDDFRTLREKMNEIISENQQLKKEHAAMRSVLSAIKTPRNNESTVGFFAHPVGNMDVTAGTNIVYTEVMTNYGEAYSANSGFFIAPVNGIYHFSAFIQTVGGADTAVVLMRGNVQQCFMETIPTDWGAASCTVVLDLDAGEEVFLRGYSDGQLHGDVDGASGFSGHLILETV